MEAKKEPTKEQLKEFWEWCLGDEAYITIALNGKQCVYQRKLDKSQPEGFSLFFIGYGWETIDLNNLFKYAWEKAVGKIFKDGHYNERNRAVKLLMDWWYDNFIKYEDYTLALFWAIWEVSHAV